MRPGSRQAIHAAGQRLVSMPLPAKGLLLRCAARPACCVPAGPTFRGECDPGFVRCIGAQDASALGVIGILSSCTAWATATGPEDFVGEYARGVGLRQRDGKLESAPLTSRTDLVRPAGYESRPAMTLLLSNVVAMSVRRRGIRDRPRGRFERGARGRRRRCEIASITAGSTRARSPRRRLRPRPARLRPRRCTCRSRRS